MYKSTKDQDQISPALPPVIHHIHIQGFYDLIA